MFKRLYIHIPLCIKKCSYCGFVSYPSKDIDIDETCNLLEQEILLSPPGGPLKSIYFGGGTPSLLEPYRVNRLIDLAKEKWGQSPEIEITLESNPGTVTPSSLAGYLEAGVNRISIGMQSLDNDTLARLGRLHSAEQSLEAFRHARAAGFRNIGIDLICGLPGQTSESWSASLAIAANLSPDHLSIYALSIEPGTPFARIYMDGDKGLPDSDQTADMLEAASNFLKSSGYEHYEISNFARPGYRSAHNSGYWLRDGCLGIGPAAHSLLADGYGLRFSNPDAYEDWAKELRSGNLPHSSPQALEHHEAMSEQIFLGLRMSDGISPDRCISLFGEKQWAEHEPAFSSLIKNGLIYENAGRLALTARGMMLSNQVLMRFV